jgi:hypothetical protein
MCSLPREGTGNHQILIVFQLQRLRASGWPSAFSALSSDPGLFHPLLPLRAQAIPGHLASLLLTQRSDGAAHLHPHGIVNKICCCARGPKHILQTCDGAPSHQLSKLSSRMVPCGPRADKGRHHSNPHLCPVAQNSCTKGAWSSASASNAAMLQQLCHRLVLRCPVSVSSHSGPSLPAAVQSSTSWLLRTLS